MYSEGDHFATLRILKTIKERTKSIDTFEEAPPRSFAGTGSLESGDSLGEHFISITSFVNHLEEWMSQMTSKMIEIAKRDLNKYFKLISVKTKLVGDVILRRSLSHQLQQSRDYSVCNTNMHFFKSPILVTNSKYYCIIMKKAKRFDPIR